MAATALTDEGTPDAAVDSPLATTAPTLFDALAADEDPAVAGLEKRPRDLDLPPWLKGRYGTAVGRAVHGVLQTIDLATGAGLEAAVAAQCQAEVGPRPRRGAAPGAGRPRIGRSCEQRRRRPTGARSTRARPSATGSSRATSTCCTAVPTGSWSSTTRPRDTSDPLELDRRVEGYRLQGAAYALAVAQATGEPVVRVTFLFLTPGGAVERDLADLPGAVADVERLVRAGAESVVA